VQHFATTREAKEFLVGKITDQARRAGISLSDVERKMLHFSETDRMAPDVSDANTTFDRDYDQARYEKKIVKIVRQLRARERRETVGDRDFWNEAVQKLREGDHYLMVMIEDAGGVRRPPGDLVRLVATALAICAISLALIIFFANR
jgi:hypothetical protein